LPDEDPLNPLSPNLSDGQRSFRFGRKVVWVSGLLLLAVVVYWLVLPLPLAAAPSPRAAAAAVSTIKVDGISYTTARAWFLRLGFKAKYDDKKQVLTLTKSDRRVEFKVDSREARLDGLRIFLGEPALVVKNVFYLSTLDLEYFLAPILRPTQLKPRKPLRTLVIDAGHGGMDSGTQHKRLKLDEKVFTLDIAQRLEKLLADQSWQILQTRTDDKFVSLNKRAEFANEVKADVFVSIHFNATLNNPAVRGTETYILTPQFQSSTSSLAKTPEDKVRHTGNSHDGWNAVLGYQVHRTLVNALKSEDRGYKRARFAVLRLVNCPAVLVEAGYLSNDEEGALINTEAYRAHIAEALANALKVYAACIPRLAPVTATPEDGAVKN
jgi:N-acetylmuramoyl-L-alanine amidase